MGIDEWLSPKDTIRQGFAGAVDESLPKVKSALGETVDTGIVKMQKGVDDAVVRFRGAAMDFVGDLEKRWEERLTKETKQQFRLLNRVLLYTLLMAAVSLGYALAKRHYGL